MYDVETQVVALASAVERSQESDAVQQASLEAAAAAATAAKAAAADAVNAFRRQLDEVKATAEAAAAEDKALDRAWRRDVVAAEPHSEALLRLFRVRKRPEEKVRPWPAVITVCALTEPKRRFGWSPLTVVPLLVFLPASQAHRECDPPSAALTPSKKHRVLVLGRCSPRSLSRAAFHLDGGSLTHGYR